MKELKPYLWTTECSECGNIMHFNQRTFAYYCCKCGSVLEV